MAKHFSGTYFPFFMCSCVLFSALLIDPLLNSNNNNRDSVDIELSAEERDRLSPLSPVKKRYNQ